MSVVPPSTKAAGATIELPGACEGWNSAEASRRNATLKYCDIGNIHTMRESQQQLVALLGAPDDESVLYHSALEATGWLKHLALVLKASIHVARRLEDEGASVLVHCSDGWDRTMQICALVQARSCEITPRYSRDTAEIPPRCYGFVFGAV